MVETTSEATATEKYSCLPKEVGWVSPSKGRREYFISLKQNVSLFQNMKEYNKRQKRM